ncbi:Hypothetical predicted protein, partial [Pelobates cultripes]
SGCRGNQQIIQINETLHARGSDVSHHQLQELQQLCEAPRSRAETKRQTCEL